MTVTSLQVSTAEGLQRVGKLIRNDRSLLIGLGIVAGVVLLALLAPVIAFLLGHGPNDQFPDETLSESGLPVTSAPGFLLGVDGSGRDVFLRTIYGARVSLLVGIPATLIAAVIGTLVGLIGGYFGGKTDTVLTELTNIALAFPFLVTALSLVTLNRADGGSTVIDPVLVVILIIALFSWTYFARLVRGQAIEIKHRPFVLAAIGSGASKSRVVFSEILPSVLPAVIVYWAVQLPTNIIAEATLSFLGLGVRPPTASWGNMIANAQETALYQVQPWLLIAPGAALALTVFGFNLVSTRLQVHFDPKNASRGE
ncbi:ABC transporter permease [Gulosibacter chungangensis]|uniref:ABC transporter permease n=2 Tax=Gulosibacter chungangensis TaxID=979746 RepID=A0A7J5B9P2_9MICO|nr:ABC transporter permease [Gulosibacter chungangensis]